MATKAVHNLMVENAEFLAFVVASLNRHVRKDWGDVDKEDKLSNDKALKEGSRLLSAYNDERFPKHGVATIWIITEADRSMTTVLFPDEY